MVAATGVCAVKTMGTAAVTPVNVWPRTVCCAMRRIMQAVAVRPPSVWSMVIIVAAWAALAMEIAERQTPNALPKSVRAVTQGITPAVVVIHLGA